ncbi:MAG: tetratricopeptide repeat protein [Candidatus Dormibacteraeota bacterium]|nr:tetratricopeptide repeat protein [Candidatus Dormibacteraeota bacterium]
MRERVRGPDHPATTDSLNNLANVLQAQGELEAARPLHERALAIRERYSALTMATVRRRAPDPNLAHQGRLQLIALGLHEPAGPPRLLCLSLIAGRGPPPSDDKNTGCNLEGLGSHLNNIRGRKPAPAPWHSASAPRAGCSCHEDGAGPPLQGLGVRFKKDVTRPPARAGTRSVGHRDEPSD